MSEIDSNTFGKILLLQSTAYVMRDSESMAGFLCRGLGGISSIETAGVFIRGKFFSENDNLPFGSEDCQRLFETATDGTLDQNEIGLYMADFQARNNVRCLRIETVFDLYGFLFAKELEKEAWKTIGPYIENTLNIVALVVENNIQKERLLKSRERLEKLVSKRTAELGKAVRRLRSEIAERKKTELERAEFAKRLRQAQKMEAIGTLAGGIAHDFNNILAAIMGYTELSLLDIKTGRDVSGHLHEINKAVLRAKDLVRQILSFARGKGDEINPVKLKNIVAEALKLLRSTLPATIVIRSNIQTDSYVMANPTQVHEIVMNLCTNAAHAMEEGGGVLEVNLKDVIVESSAPLVRSGSGFKPGEYVKLTVSDTGHGISPDIIERIFDPYFTTKKHGEGTGMGLAIAHGTVKSYRGKITVESEPGKGTVFTVYLPAEEKKDPYVPRDAKKTPTGTERILFIDDEPALARMGGQILERLGYSVVTRTDSLDALELFRAAPREFDLVITDMTMPNMTGDKLSAALKAIRLDIPVVLCTGYSNRIPDARTASTEIDGLVFKPLAMDELAKTIRSALKKTKSS